MGPISYKGNYKTLLVAIKEVGVEVNTEKINTCSCLMN
jgi:hypothetical protein